MDPVIGVGLRIGLLVLAVAAPGWALLRLTGFRSQSRYDRILAGLALGSAWTAGAVTTLLLTHTYFRVTAIMILAAPVVAALAMKARATADLPALRVSPSRSAVDRAVLAAAAAFIALYFVDAALSPITSWDGIAAWNKWAADWGRRTDSLGYAVGGYPQLAPRVVSVLYKLTGAHSDPLPLDAFASHGFHVLFAAWFVVAAVRLSDLLELPAWPAVLAGMGAAPFREHIGAGTVDVLVTAQVTTLLALYIGAAKGTWRTRVDASWVLAASLFATIFSKLTGILGPLLVLSLHGAFRKQSGTSVNLGRAFAKAALLLLPFLLEQGYTELQGPRFQPDPFEVNMAVRNTPTMLAVDADATYRGGGLSSRPHLVQLRFWNSYEVPATLRLLFSVSLFGCLALSMRTWFGRAALPVVLGYALMWALWASYDQRNLFVALPVVALLVTVGAREAWRLRPSTLWQTVVALFAGVLVVLAGSALLKDLQARATNLAQGDQAIARRVHAIGAGPDARVDFFYPRYANDFHYVRALADRTGAAHVMVTSPMYRFLARGVHVFGLWRPDVAVRGDLFVGHEDRRPPVTPDWVLVSRGETHRVWAFAPDIRSADDFGNASPTFTAQDLAQHDGVVVWVMGLRPPADNVDVQYQTHGGLQLDPVSSIARETLEDGTLRVSGIVAVATGADALPPDAGVSIVMTDGDASPETFRIGPGRHP